MRKITSEGLELIKEFEGFSPKIYIDPAGLMTIGYGHLVQQEEIAIFQTGISKIQAEELLLKDVAKAQNAVLRLTKTTLTDGQYAALVSFTFNLGAGAYQRSTLRRKVNRQEHDEAPAEFRRWVWAGGKKLPGLIRRRNAEAKLYMTG